MISFESFAEEVRSAVSERLGVKVESMDVPKSNGVTKKAIVIHQGTCMPTVYLEGAYEKYTGGEMTVEQCTEELISAIGSTPAAEFDLSILDSFDTAKDFIRCRLLNFKMNEQMAQDCPYRLFGEDLAVFYSCVVADGASALIHNHFLSKWGVSEEDLYNAAEQNILMDAVLEGIGGLNVLTNTTRVYGASSILSDVVRENLYEEFGKYFIIPSSVHEVIILPDNGSIDAEYVNEMIESINAECVAEEEVLSNHVYYYDGTEVSVLRESAA